MRFAIFVDGSNLYGSIKSMHLKVPEYQAFFNYIFRKAVEARKVALYSDVPCQIELRRVYWYAVGEMDVWNFDDPNTVKIFRDRLSRDAELKKKYCELAGRKLQNGDQSMVMQEASEILLHTARSWYDKKVSSLNGMKSFYHAVQRDTDFIEIIATARWKLDVFRQSAIEKGLDTALAVDMIAQQDNYDVAILISGDADNIPSVKYIGNHNKVFGVVDFLEGYPPERQGRQSSHHLKSAADFVVPVYEMDLIAQRIAEKDKVLVDAI